MYPPVRGQQKDNHLTLEYTIWYILLLFKLNHQAAALSIKIHLKGSAKEKTVNLIQKNLLLPNAMNFVEE